MTLLDRIPRLRAIVVRLTARRSLPAPHGGKRSPSLFLRAAIRSAESALSKPAPPVVPGKPRSGEIVA